MRLNLDGTTPGDNPYLSSIDPNFCREIYGYGFRNPFRVAIRRTGSGAQDFELFANDVGSSGSSRREEVNLVKLGRSYGWPDVEGIGAPDPRHENPLHDYSEEGEAIVGGVFYEGVQFPADRLLAPRRPDPAAARDNRREPDSAPRGRQETSEKES